MKQVGTYTMTRKIGKGHYAQVYEGRNSETGEQVAVKCLKRTGISNTQLRNIENEVLVLERSGHPNVISLIDRMKSKNSYYLILEYCNGGDLASIVAERGRLRETEARDAV